MDWVRSELSSERTMLWLKILLACLTVGFSVGIGYLAANKYRSRYAFYRQFQDFNERYLSELEYARKPLPVFVREYEDKGDFSGLLGDWLKTRSPQVKLSYLSSDEREQCCAYFSMLGRGNAQAQAEYFGTYKPSLSEKKAACEKESRERGMLYLKLGLLAGLALVILMI